jgi:AbrB family looped-hinge helix DNA binding protein
VKTRAIAKSETTVRIDTKGRVMLPKNFRDALALEPGDTVFLRFEQSGKVVRLARAASPFDILVVHAISEYEEGRTRSIEEFAREHNISL